MDHDFSNDVYGLRSNFINDDIAAVTRNLVQPAVSETLKNIFQPEVSKIFKELAEIRTATSRPVSRGPVSTGGSTQSEKIKQFQYENRQTSEQLEAEVENRRRLEDEVAQLRIELEESQKLARRYQKLTPGAIEVAEEITRAKAVFGEFHQEEFVLFEHHVLGTVCSAIESVRVSVSSAISSALQATFKTNDFQSSVSAAALSSDQIADRIIVNNQPWSPFAGESYDAGTRE